MTEGERIKQIRTSEEVNLTLEKFGEKVGVTKTAISNIEKGKRNVTEQMRKSICREFNANYIFLVDGTGDMFLSDETSVMCRIDRIMYGENEFHKNLIKMTVDLSMEELKVIEGILDKYIDLKKKKADD